MRTALKILAVLIIGVALGLGATWFTAQVADRIVSSAAILLILADTGISLYDLALMIGLIS